MKKKKSDCKINKTVGGKTDLIQKSCSGKKRNGDVSGPSTSQKNNWRKKLKTKQTKTEMTAGEQTRTHKMLK